jgi:transcriptional regulator with XRE-family HTH domain
MWLRSQRLARGWNGHEMARQLERAARAGGQTVPAVTVLVAYVWQWERGPWVPSDRYQRVYCAALGIGPEQFGVCPLPADAPFPGTGPGPARPSADTLAGLYQSRSVRQVADHLGITYGRARNWLISAGVEMRPRGGAHGVPPGHHNGRKEP